MLSLATIGALFAGMSLLLAILVAVRPELTRARGGKIFAFTALFIFPLLATWIGGTEKMESSKQTGFCLSCHVMADHGRSLYIDDPSFLPAAHFQNRRIPREQACFTCHSDYTYFGGVSAKWRGLRHVYVQYFGTVPKPADIKLYSPFPNRTCLHCHEGARSFQEESAHEKQENFMQRVKSEQLSCMSSGCHDFIHEVESINDNTFWNDAGKETP